MMKYVAVVWLVLWAGLCFAQQASLSDRDSLMRMQQSMRSTHREIFPKKMEELILRYGNRTIPDLALKKHASYMSEHVKQSVKSETQYQRIDAKERKSLLKKSILTNCKYNNAPNDQKQLCCEVHGMTTCLPNFVIIGAQKSGTTALYAYLMHHPQIRYAKDKELHFFDFPSNWNMGLRHYMRLFDNHASYDHASSFITGEASPSYMAMRGVCKRIRMTIPHAKIIAVLRDPVKRAWSEFQMGQRIGKVQDELKNELSDHVKQLRKCLEGSLFSTASPPGNETRRESGLRIKYTTMALADCMPKQVSEMEQWRLFITRLIAQSATSAEWKKCWKMMKEATDDLKWSQLWDICTRGMLARTSDTNQLVLRDDALMFLDRLHRDAKKINHCIKMPEYEDDFMSCNESPFPSDLSTDYIWRGMFAKQLEECRRWFPKDQVLVLEQDDLRKDPIPTLKKVQEFLGVPEYDYESMSNKDAMALFNEVYPGFEATTGWRAKESYGDVPEEAKKFLIEFFEEHNGDLYKMLDRTYSHWSRWDPDDFQEYYYFSNYY